MVICTGFNVYIQPQEGFFAHSSQPLPSFLVQFAEGNVVASAVKASQSCAGVLIILEGSSLLI